MLEELFSEIQDLLWGIGITGFAIVALLILPNNLSIKLGEHPVLLIILFTLIISLVIRVFN